MVTYFLPMRPGSTKTWLTRTESFYCCTGSLVQAHSLHGTETWYEDGEGLVLAEYLPSRLEWSSAGVPVTLTVTEAGNSSMTADGSGRVDLGLDVGVGRPGLTEYRIEVEAARPVDFTLRVRIPWWAGAAAEVRLGGEVHSAPASSFLPLARTWHRDAVTVRLPRRLVAEELPGRPGTVAFVDGPVVLAGLCDEERTLRGDPADPLSLLAPDDEREWDRWNARFRTVGQQRNLRFVPLHEVTDERYTVYFPVE
jgi:uncharacterized protein